jgi:hypothetical protein
MGNLPSSIDAALHSDVAPDYTNPSKFDPLTGFQNGRKERGFHLSIQAYSFAELDCFLFVYCHSLSRVVVPATLHSISVNTHFTRFL